MTIIITPNYPETKTDFKQHKIVNKVRRFSDFKNEISNNVLFMLNCTTHSSVLLLCVVLFNVNKTFGNVFLLVTLWYFKFNVMYAVFQTTISSVWLKKGISPIVSAPPQLRIYTDRSYTLSSSICQLSCLAKCNAQNLYFLQLFCPNTLPPLSICSLHFGYEKLWVCFQT